jgi:oxalate decarboxylase/phosphoglucose isomerase-like protein (cupin superfamily)
MVVMHSVPRTARFERLPLRADARGFVFEPAASDELPLQRNAHVVRTAPGAIRGNHHHRLGTEILTVIGPALVRVKEAGTIRDVTVAAGEVMRCVFPPFVAHAISNPGPGDQVLVAFNTYPHDPAAPDVVRDEIL